jgi:malonyl CoA-acyl carrier protein transacylase
MVNIENFNKSVFIFPAFGERISEKDLLFYNKNTNIFDEYFLKMKSISNIDLNISNYNDSLINELNSQIIAFTFSCTSTEILKKMGIYPVCTSGYSMGLYASLYNAGSIDFTSGISLIKKIYDLILQEIKDKDFSIATIIGLELPDIKKILKKYSTKIEIINSNNRINFVISGITSDVENVLKDCLEEGAMNSKMLPAKCPYHSEFVHKPADEFYKYIKNEINISESKIPVISTINQRSIKSKNDIIDELVMNIKHNINWNETMNKIVKSGYNHFIECGIGKSLTKMAKFIDGDFKIISLDNF